MIFVLWIVISKRSVFVNRLYVNVTILYSFTNYWKLENMWAGLRVNIRRTNCIVKNPQNIQMIVNGSETNLNNGSILFAQYCLKWYPKSLTSSAESHVHKLYGISHEYIFHKISVNSRRKMVPFYGKSRHTLLRLVHTQAILFL